MNNDNIDLEFKKITLIQIVAVPNVTVSTLSDDTLQLWPSKFTFRFYMTNSPNSKVYGMLLSKYEDSRWIQDPDAEQYIFGGNTVKNPATKPKYVGAEGIDESLQFDSWIGYDPKTEYTLSMDFYPQFHTVILINYFYRYEDSMSRQLCSEWYRPPVEIFEPFPPMSCENYTLSNYTIFDPETGIYNEVTFPKICNNNTNFYALQLENWIEFSSFITKYKYDEKHEGENILLSDCFSGLKLNHDSTVTHMQLIDKIEYSVNGGQWTKTVPYVTYLYGNTSSIKGKFRITYDNYPTYEDEFELTISNKDIYKLSVNFLPKYDRENTIEKYNHFVTNAFVNDKISLKNILKNKFLGFEGYHSGNEYGNDINTVDKHSIVDDTYGPMTTNEVIWTVYSGVKEFTVQFYEYEYVTLIKQLGEILKIKYNDYPIIPSCNTPPKTVHKGFKSFLFIDGIVVTDKDENGNDLIFYLDLMKITSNKNFYFHFEMLYDLVWQYVEKSTDENIGDQHKQESIIESKIPFSYDIAKYYVDLQMPNKYTLESISPQTDELSMWSVSQYDNERKALMLTAYVNMLDTYCILDDSGNYMMAELKKRLVYSTENMFDDTDIKSFELPNVSLVFNTTQVLKDNFSNNRTEFTSVEKISSYFLDYIGTTT